MSPDLTGLPGAEIVNKGINDLATGTLSTEALLVSMAMPKLKFLGVNIDGDALEDPEMTLFRRLNAQDPDNGYRDYNALRRRLDRFCRALEHRVMSAHRAAVVA